ncbi:cell wall / vacuolar inhibitor of fructosidase 1-like [Pyrus x bretschneideri]|uniref:cell wall / vacuolar inhibitor of fructosidase 1-like n=1 Tax=Pyrus x bretschneideri TaxID=225117 RepID=UPI00202F5C3F|nr:cell wall / vacuolar inhibitor of fructosidase 1-like [Pyrus x bretschneideri]
MHLNSISKEKMKNDSTSPSTKALIFLIQIVFLVVFLPTSHCSRPAVFFTMDANLIEQTCNQTPYPDLCVSTLQSDSRSTEADVKGLGIKVVDAVKPKAIEAMNNALELIEGACGNTYHQVFGTDIPQASEAFSKGDSKIAEIAMINVVEKADSCESGLLGGSRSFQR